MISYLDLSTLDDERAELVGELFERARTIEDLPPDLGRVRAWDDFIVDCEQVGFPHLIASARFDQYSLLAQGGRAEDALTAFVRLMQLLHRHGDLVDPRNVDVMLNAIATASMTLTDDPAIALDRIGRAVDLVEQESRRRGADLTGVHVARAVLASAAGNRADTMAAIERWRAGAGEGWRSDSSGVIQIEIPLIAPFDLPLATETLAGRLRMLALDLDRIDLERPDVDDLVPLLVMHGFLLLRQGDRAGADRIVAALLDALDPDDLIDRAVPDYLIPLLEPHGDLAQAAADRTLGELELDESHWEVTAAIARARLLADPAGTEGALLRALAEQAADAHDRRGGTDLATRELVEFWFADLPATPRPTVTEDPTIWGDRENRAEVILSAGWLQRMPPVTDDPPIALKDRYVALGEGLLDILSAESGEEADRATAAILDRGRQLNFATALYGAPLLHGVRAAQNGDTVTLVADYAEAQIRLLDWNLPVSGMLRTLSTSVFPVVVQAAVLTPEVDWQQIHQVVEREVRVRALMGTPTAPILVARAEIATALGDGAGQRQAILDLHPVLEQEEDDLDRLAIELELIRMTVWYASDFAAGLARQVREVGDAEQSRIASAWLLWMAALGGDRSATAALAELVGSVDGDVTAFDPLPGWVLIEGLAGDPGLLTVIDALLAEVDLDSAHEFCLFAAAGSALLALAPQDPRGPQLRDRALAVASALDARNGHPHWVEILRTRWFPAGAAR